MCLYYFLKHLFNGVFKMCGTRWCKTGRCNAMGKKWFSNMTYLNLWDCKYWYKCGLWILYIYIYIYIWTLNIGLMYCLSNQIQLINNTVKKKLFIALCMIIPGNSQYGFNVDKQLDLWMPIYILSSILYWLLHPCCLHNDKLINLLAAFQKVNGKWAQSWNYLNSHYNSWPTL